MPRQRQKELRQRRKRKKKLKKLKKRLAEAKTLKEREHLIYLIRKREPFFTPPEE